MPTINGVYYNDEQLFPNHIISYSKEERERLIKEIADNIIKYYMDYFQVMSDLAIFELKKYKSGGRMPAYLYGIAFSMLYETMPMYFGLSKHISI